MTHAPSLVRKHWHAGNAEGGRNHGWGGMRVVDREGDEWEGSSHGRVMDESWMSHGCGVMGHLERRERPLPPVEAVDPEKARLEELGVAGEVEREHTDV